MMNLDNADILAFYNPKCEATLTFPEQKETRKNIMVA